VESRGKWKQSFISADDTRSISAISACYDNREWTTAIKHVNTLIQRPQATAMTRASFGRGARPITGRIRILLVDDHEVVRHGLRQLLAREDDMEVIGEAATGADALRLVDVTRPDVVLLDAKLGDLDGSEVCRRTLAVSPTTAVVILTGYVQDGAVLKSLAAGAKGYLIKDVEIAEVKRAIRAVYRGHSVLDPRVASNVIARVKGNSPRGRADLLSDSDLLIVRHIAAGLTNKQIAAEVHLSPHTIKDRLEKIAATFDVRSRTEIVAQSMRAGLL
jgi:two-component system, NarL family, response regulator DevR